MFFGSEENRVKAPGEELKNRFKSLKGGGKGSRSGKFVGVWLADREGKTALAPLSRTHEYNFDFHRKGKSK